MRYRIGALATLVILQVGCATTTPSPSASQDYYRSLRAELVVERIGSCLRGEDDCDGFSEAWARYRGPKFNPRQRLTILEWSQEQIGKSVGVLQVKIKDSGIIYDTAVNVDAVVKFGPRNSLSFGIKNIYGGDWAFSANFADAARSVAIIGGAAAYGTAKAIESTSKYSESVGSLLLNTGTLCGEGSITIVDTRNGATRNLDCCGWGNLGAKSFSLPASDYSLSYDIRSCTGKRYLGSSVKVTVPGRSSVTLQLFLESGRYSVR